MAQRLYPIGEVAVAHKTLHIEADAIDDTVDIIIEVDREAGESEVDVDQVAEMYVPVDKARQVAALILEAIRVIGSDGE